ncbi:MAG TPA: carbohydrate ABC transporter permease [Candidatus Ruania gallistercoris]|uniref:Carbohydrate ABC transporter permease n=1 Tax=Candidatus Ruania gallistercoris TaxID=2838746 RepID=A0A9D2EHG3_9MICO|nr:carbohydrate ABC transporter permease [Candidatus Ruania gallistercoris]
MKTATSIESRGFTRFRTVFLIIFGLVCLAPIAWMLLASVKTNIDIYDPASTFSFTPTLQNYVSVFAQADFLQFFINSLVIGVGSTALSLLIGVPAAYSMQRFGMVKSSGMILLSRVIPHVTLLVPWYFIFASMRMVGGYSSLIISHMFIAVPLIVWVMIGVFEGVPEELEEAARVDGLTHIGAFRRIVVPLVVPGIATSSILSFIFSWNNFVFALVLSGNDTRTLPVAIFNFIGYASIDWGALMAACVSITAPMIVMALLGQKYVVAGMTAGAVKG